MSPTQISVELKKQADYILHELKFCDILSHCGRVIPTGSYFLDLMIYPDIDFYVTKVPIEKVFEMAGELVKSNLVFEVKMEKSDDDPRMRGGYYLKLFINYGNWKRHWKIDIWFLEDSHIDEVMETMQSFKDRITPELKEKILNYKFSVINEQHRTPMYSGYFIYKAMIDEGMTDYEDITKYLIDNGINVNKS
ncbi:MAG: YceI family protein [Ignavibacteriae bacterium]|nr:MAG: YceI family protein [Ignavibacteriota bacterium]